MSPGIVADGMEQTLDALEAEQREAVGKLRAAIKAENDPHTKAALKEQLRQVKRAFAERVKGARRSLY